MHQRIPKPVKKIRKCCNYLPHYTQANYSNPHHHHRIFIRRPLQDLSGAVQYDVSRLHKELIIMLKLIK